MSERDNIKRCKRSGCTRATFVETDEGVSVKFRHGSDKHTEVYTTEEMIDYLRRKGYVVVEATSLLKVA